MSILWWAVVIAAITIVINGIKTKIKESAQRTREPILTTVATVPTITAEVKENAEPAKYVASTSVLTMAELQFFRALTAAIKADQHILTKVRLLDLIQPQSGLNHSAYTAAKNRVIQKHADFVVCDRTSMKPIAVIELNDSSHQFAHRHDRDKFVANALEGAGLRVHFIPARSSYNPEQLRSLLASDDSMDALGVSRL